MKNYNKLLHKKSTILLIVIGWLFTFPIQSMAQVSIAPTSLFFNNQNRFATLTVSNSGKQAQEISISTAFGYPTSKDGKLYIAKDSVLAQTKSIADWIRAFPKNFTLQANQRQTVRFIVRPGQDLKPGGYWSRVKISSTAASTPIDSLNQSQVGAQINLVLNQIISAHFHTPGAQTDVSINSVDYTQKDHTKGMVGINMEQNGNAPFMGTLSLSILDSNGKAVYKKSTTTSVYTTITRNFNVNLSDIAPGTYTISGTLKSSRPDIDTKKLLQINPVPFSKKITVE